MTTKKIAIDFANIDNSAGFVSKPIDNKLLRIDCWNDTKQICETIPSPPLSIREHYEPDFYYQKQTKHQIFIFMTWILSIVLYYSKNHWY